MTRSFSVSRRTFGGLLVGSLAGGLIRPALAEADPVAELQAFFRGGLKGEGQYISTVDSRPPRGMIMQLASAVADGQLVMKQDVAFSDGARDSNVWHFRRIENGGYVGTRTKVEGEVPVEIDGNAIHLTYTAPVPTEDGQWMTVRFTDRLERKSSRRVEVTTKVSYFGLTVGHGEILFQR